MKWVKFAFNCMLAVADLYVIIYILRKWREEK